MKDRTAELKRSEAAPGRSARPEKRTAEWYDQVDADASSQLLPAKASHSHFVHVRKVIIMPRRLSPFHRFRNAQKGDGHRFVASLQKQMGEIEAAVKAIQSNTRTLAELHTRVLMSPSQSSDDQTRMDSVERDTRAAFSRATALIKGLEGAAPPGAALQRVHSTQLFHARQSLSTAMVRHEAELKRYADGLRKLIAKQISIARGAGPDADDVEVCIEQGHLQLFIDNYQAQEQQARTMLADVSERHRELAELEKSIAEVSHLFSGMHVLVLTQGEMLDSIEAHVLAAADQVTDGRGQLKTAKKKKKSARKKKMLLAGIGTGVVAALVATMAIL